MLLQELKEKAYGLSKSDRLALISALVQSLQNMDEVEEWQYLVTHAHPWRRQLYIKGRKLLRTSSLSSTSGIGIASIRLRKFRYYLLWLNNVQKYRSPL